MEDNFNNYQNEDNSFNGQDDEQFKNSINLNNNENSQNFDEDEIEDEDVNNNNIEFIQNSENDKNISSRLNNQPNYKDEIPYLPQKPNQNNKNYQEFQNNINYPVHQQFNPFNQYNNRSQNKIRNQGNFATDFNQNGIKNFSEQFNQNNQYYNIGDNKYMNNGNNAPSFNANPNEMLNLSSQFYQQNQFNERAQYGFINQENFIPDFYTRSQQNLRPQYDQYNQYNYRSRNKIVVPGDFAIVNNPNEMQTTQINKNYQFNNMLENQLLKRKNLKPYFNNTPNEMANLSQNNQFNNLNQKRFLSQQYSPSGNSEITNNPIILFANLMKNFLYQLQPIINKSQNPTYMFGNNNNNLDLGFQHPNQNLNHAAKNYKNYSKLNRENKNNISYNKTKNNTNQNEIKQKNLNNISNNNQIKENKLNISEKNENINYSHNNLNLNKNYVFKNIKDLNINSLFDENRIKYFPDLNEFIKNKANINNYKLNEEDNKILDESNNEVKKGIFFNEYMFYSRDKISIYSPHIIKREKNIKSILLLEKEKNLDLLDFQYANYHKNKNDIFFLTLQGRIKDINNLMGKNNNTIEDENIKKKFGFCKNKNNDNYYLYSIIDEEIIKNKLKENDIKYLSDNLLMNETQNRNQRSDILEFYDKNMEFLKGLTFEELILFIILDRLENNFEILPKILFYENYMTLFGDRIIFSDYPGYNEIDFVMYSKIDQKYTEDCPLIIQNYYDSEKIETNLEFEIKKNTLYFFELKYSSYYIKDDFFDSIFNKCLEFTNLYETKNIIDKNIKKEIMLIYDDANDYSLSTNYKKKIKKFLKENEHYSFNIVYSIKTYSYFSHSLALKKYDNIKKQNENLEKLMNAQSNKLTEQQEINNNLIQEIQNLKEQISELKQNQKK